VQALGPVPVKGLAEPVEVFELVGGTTLRRRLQAVARACRLLSGGNPNWRRCSRLWPGAGAPRGRSSPPGEPGVGKSRLVYEFIHAHHTQGGCGWRVARCPTVRPLRTCRSCDLLKAYCHIEDRDDLRTVRAKITGQI